MNHGAFHVVKKEEVRIEREKGMRYVSSLLFNQVAYVVGIGSTLFNIPQIITIWANKDAQGVSLLSWVGFSIASLFWLFYSIHHKEKALIITFGLNFLFQFAIIVGVIIY